MSYHLSIIKVEANCVYVLCTDVSAAIAFVMFIAGAVVTTVVYNGGHFKGGGGGVRKGKGEFPPFCEHLH